MLNDKIKTQVSCADDCDSEAISVETARRKILAKISSINSTEKLTLHQSLNRVIAQDIVSTLNVPGHTNSAMDGYALSGDDLPETSILQYQVIGTAFAGRPFEQPCFAGECVRIMTGAVMPAINPEYIK